MDDTSLLQDAIINAREFENFDKVLLAVSLHPEWLTFIPDDRQWPILHQIVLSGNLDHLDQLLALQKGNKRFNPLVCTRDGKTIETVANERVDAPEVKARIQKLLKLDKMLTYARSCKWDECYDIIKANPSFANEKPPYRRYYLIHHMACVGAIDKFERFEQIPNCKFQVTLRADHKSILVIARDCNCAKFAEYMERKYSNLFNNDDTYPASVQAEENTAHINLIMTQRNVVQGLDQSLLTKSTPHKTRSQLMKQLEDFRSPVVKEPIVVTPAAAVAERENVNKGLFEILTCPLTLAIFVDPVVAADGFTYEHSAITKWLSKNNTSPMTNQTLVHKNLHTNIVILQILQSLLASTSQ